MSDSKPEQPWGILGEAGFIILESNEGYRDDCTPIIVAARLKAGKPEGKLVKSEVVAGGILVEVADVQVGPRGGVKWLKPYVKAILTKDDFIAAGNSIKVGGLCPDCSSSGLRFISWRKGEGSTFMACQVCSGTGSGS